MPTEPINVGNAGDAGEGDGMEATVKVLRNGCLIGSGFEGEEAEWEWEQTSGGSNTA